MSTGWTHFLSQYESEAQQKLDGYDASHFEGLTEPELTRARAMVIARAEAGETPEIDALPLLNTPAVLPVIAGLLDRVRAPTLTRLRACVAGWKITRAPAYQHEILAIASAGDDFVRSQAIIALCAMRLEPVALSEVEGMLRTEGDRALAVQLAKAVLRSRSVPVDTPEEFQRALPLLRAIANVNLHDRNEAIGRVDELIAAHRGA